MKHLLTIIFSLALLLTAQAALAATSMASGYAWSERVGWISFNDAGSLYEVTVGATSLGDYAWSENAGWIKLSGDCNDAGGCPDGGDTYAVSTLGSGCGGGNICLTGYAWGEGVGWISFATSTSDYSNDSSANYGVYIDSSDDFQGYAWGEQTGWISFNGSCDEASGCPGGLTTYKVEQVGGDMPYALSMAYDNKALFEFITGGTTYSATSTTDINDNEWHNVTATYDSSNIKMYVDGILEDTTAGSGGLPTNAGNVRIGADYNVIAGNFWDGLIDEVRLYNRALSADEVLNLYQVGARRILIDPNKSDKTYFR